MNETGLYIIVHTWKPWIISYINNFAEFAIKSYT